MKAEDVFKHMHHPWRYHYINYQVLKDIVKDLAKLRHNMILIDSQYTLGLPTPAYKHADQRPVVHDGGSEQRDADIHSDSLASLQPLLARAPPGQSFISIEIPPPTTPPPIAPEISTSLFLGQCSQIQPLVQSIHALDSFFIAYLWYQVQIVNRHYNLVLAYVNTLEKKAKSLSMTVDNASNQQSILATYNECHELRDLLRSYIQLNYIICIKVLRMHDKALHVHFLGPLMSHIHEQPFYIMIDRSIPYAHATSKEHRLRAAASLGDTSAMLLEIATGANVNSTNAADGTTPLMVASLHGHINCVELLLKYNADIDAVNNNGTCALTLSIINSHKDVATMLISKKADVNIQDEGGRKSPLMYAAQKGMYSVALALLKSNANVHLTDRIKQTALLLACENGRANITELLLSYGSSILHQNDLKQNSIASAASGNHVECLQLLLKSSQAQELIRSGTGNITTHALARLSSPTRGNLFQDIDLTLPSSALPIVSASVRGNIGALGLLINVFSQWHDIKGAAEEKEKKKVTSMTSNASDVSIQSQDNIEAAVGNITDSDTLNTSQNPAIFPKSEDVSLSGTFFSSQNDPDFFPQTTINVPETIISPLSSPKTSASPTHSPKITYSHESSLGPLLFPLLETAENAQIIIPEANPSQNDYNAIKMDTLSRPASTTNTPSFTNLPMPSVTIDSLNLLPPLNQQVSALVTDPAKKSSKQTITTTTRDIDDLGMLSPLVSTIAAQYKNPNAPPPQTATQKTTSTNTGNPSSAAIRPVLDANALPTPQLAQDSPKHGSRAPKVESGNISSRQRTYSVDTIAISPSQKTAALNTSACVQTPIIPEPELVTFTYPPIKAQENLPSSSTSSVVDSEESRGIYGRKASVNSLTASTFCDPAEEQQRPLITSSITEIEQSSITTVDPAAAQLGSAATTEASIHSTSSLVSISPAHQTQADLFDLQQIDTRPRQQSNDTAHSGLSQSNELQPINNNSFQPAADDSHDVTIAHEIAGRTFPSPPLILDIWEDSRPSAKKRMTYTPNRVQWMDMRDKYGCTALLRAAEYGHYDVMQLLLKNGSNPDSTRLGGRSCCTSYEDGEDGEEQREVSRLYKYDGDLSTPLMLCANHNDVKGVALLLEYHANVDIQRLDGSTAILCAADRGFDEVVELLLKAGADVNVSNQYGYSPLIRCAIGTYNNNYKRCMQLLLQYGADVNAKTKDGSTGLILASARGVLSVISTLLGETDIDLDHQDDEGCTALIKASRWGHVDVVIQLLDAGARVDLTDANGRTCLHSASVGGYYRSVKILLQRGADPRAVDDNGFTARELATHLKHISLLPLFKDHEVREKERVAAEHLGATTTQQTQLALSPTHTALSTISSVHTPQNSSTSVGFESPSTTTTPLMYAGKAAAGSATRPPTLVQKHHSSNLQYQQLHGLQKSQSAYNSSKQLIDTDGGVDDKILNIAGLPVSPSNEATPNSAHSTGNSPALLQPQLPIVHPSATSNTNNNPKEEDKKKKFLLETFEDCYRLRKCATNGDIERLRQLLDCYQSRFGGFGFGSYTHTGPQQELRSWCDLPDQFGNSALILAAAHGRVQCVQALLRQTNGYCDVNLKNRAGRNALMSSARRGYLRCVMVLLNTPGIAIDDCDELGNNLLHLLAKKGHSKVLLEIFQWLYLAHFKEVMTELGGDPNIARYNIDNTMPAPSPSQPFDVKSPHSSQIRQLLLEQQQVREFYNNFSVRIGGAGASFQGLNFSTSFSQAPTVLPSSDSAPPPQPPYNAGVTAANGAMLTTASYYNPDSATSTTPSPSRRRLHKDNGSDVDDSAAELLHQSLDYIPLQQHHLKTLVNSFNEQGETPLFLAATNGYHDIVELLLEHHAQPDLVFHGDDGETYDTPLLSACLNGRTSIVKLLLKHGASPHVIGRSLTPLNAACMSGHSDIVEVLLSHSESINIEAKDKYGSTALIRAVRDGHLDCVIALLKHGANVNALGENGTTALITAALEHHKNSLYICKALLMSKADVNCRGEGGSTALIHAAHKGFADVVQLLLSYGADTEITNIHGHTALIRTVYWNRNSWGNDQCMELLLKAGANPNAVAEHGNTALHIAAYRAFTNAIITLINYGADVNATNSEGTTPLMRASLWGIIPPVQALLFGGAQTHAIDQFGRTALWHACTLNRLDAVRVLLEWKSPWNTCAYNGKTPLDIAREREFEQIVVLLEGHRDQEYRMTNPIANNGNQQHQIIQQPMQLPRSHIAQTFSAHTPATQFFQQSLSLDQQQQIQTMIQQKNNNAPLAPFQQ